MKAIYYKFVIISNFEFVVRTKVKMKMQKRINMKICDSKYMQK